MAALCILALRAGPAFAAPPARSPATRPAAAPARSEFTLGKHDGAVTAVAFSDDNAFFASGVEDGTVTVWNLATKRSCYSLKLGAPITALAFSRDGERLLVVWGGAIREYGLRSADPGSIYSEVWMPISAFALAPNGSGLVIGTEKGAMIPMEYPKFLQSNKPVSRDKLPARPVNFFWSDDSNHFLSVDAEGRWRRWQLLPGSHFVRPVNAPPPEPTKKLGDGPLTLTADRRILAIFRGDRGVANLALYRFQDRTPIEPPMACTLPEDTTPRSLTLSRDNRTIAAGASDGRIYFWDFTPALLAAGIAAPDGPNPLMGPGSDDRLPELTEKIEAPENDSWGYTQRLSGFTLEVAGQDKLRIARRRIENGKPTIKGRDGLFRPGSHFLSLPAGRYILYYSNMMEPGIIHRTEPFEVVFRRLPANAYYDFVAEHRPLTVILGDNAAGMTTGKVTRQQVRERKPG